MNEQLEILISQYADGTLPEAERMALEAKLAEDAEAQALLADDRALTALLRLSPLPTVEWDRLAESISSAIDAHMEERMARASLWMRMRVPAAFVAMAASIVIIAGVGMRAFRSSTAPTGPGQSSIAMAPASSISIEGPAEDKPDGTAVAEISIGAGGAYAKDASLTPYSDDIDSRPGRVVIASGLPVQSGSIPFPY